MDEEIPCLRQLLHWNESPAEGKGKTHAAIVHRLRQLHRDDLADWLGETTFKQLGKDLDNAITLSFEEIETTTLAALLYFLSLYSGLCKKQPRKNIFQIHLHNALGKVYIFPM